jgi:predicted transcriptional regulator
MKNKEPAAISEPELTGEYRTTPVELAGIERGLADARAGRFATDQQVEAALAGFRKACL